jgi:ATP-binding cassette subfamily F protein 3
MIDDLSDVAPRATQTELRTLLGCFLFSDDDAFKKIGVLSGGERNRFALARMLMTPSNFLLLDEPTNHLDMRAKDVLLESIEKYTGTVVFVSHDRYFIDKLATRVIEIEDGHVHVYPGNYEDYLWRKQGGGTMAVTAAAPVVAAAPEPATAEPKRRVNPMKLQKLKEKLGEVEQQVASLESQIAQHEAALSDFKSVDETLRRTGEVAACRAELESRVAEWEAISAEMEAL